MRMGIGDWAQSPFLNPQINDECYNESIIIKNKKIYFTNKNLKNIYICDCIKIILLNKKIEIISYYLT